MNQTNVNSKSILVCKSFPGWQEYASKQPDPKKLFSDFWSEKEICFLFADTGAGKSILAVLIACYVATGNSFDDSLKNIEEDTNEIDFTPTDQAQTVLYFEFELNEKQFEMRYKDESTDKHFPLPNNAYRYQLDLTNLDLKKSMPDQVLEQIEKEIQKKDAKIIIIDNITYIKNSTSNTASSEAVKFMHSLKILKEKYKLSILVLAHTPKRDLQNPITINDMSDSKNLINFSDSAFAIGFSCKEPGKEGRYIIQLKTRLQARRFGTSSVISCKLNKREGFTTFDFLGYEFEYFHLKKPNPNEQRNNTIIEAYKNGEGTQEELAKRYDMTRENLNRIINKTKTQDESY